MNIKQLLQSLLNAVKSEMATKEEAQTPVATDELFPKRKQFNY